MRVFLLSFRLVHRNYPGFRAKDNLDNTYTLAILKLFGIILIPSNPFNPFKNQTFKLRREDRLRDPASRAGFSNFHRFGYFGQKLIKIGLFAGCLQPSL